MTEPSNYYNETSHGQWAGFLDYLTEVGYEDQKTLRRLGQESTFLDAKRSTTLVDAEVLKHWRSYCE